MKLPLAGYRIFEWPEFLALVDRLGIDRTRPLISLRIDVPGSEEAVTWTATYEAEANTIGELIQEMEDANSPEVAPIHAKAAAPEHD